MQFKTPINELLCFWCYMNYDYHNCLVKNKQFGYRKVVGILGFSKWRKKKRSDSSTSKQ